jgi:hypothetical protein
MFSAPRYSFTRPADGTAYGSADLVANDTDAADVVPLKWRAQSGAGRIVAATLFTDDETVTNANFTLYLFRSAPSPSVGDNGVFALDSAEPLIGTVAMDLTSGATATSTDKFKRFAISTPISFQADTLYGLLATAAAYDPDGAETFTVTLEIEE